MFRIFFFLSSLLLSFSVNASVVYYLAAVPEDQIVALTEDEENFRNFLFSEGQDHLYLDKEWHGVHWLLSRDAGITNLPASKILLGGANIGPDLDYGSAQIHSPAKVKEIAALLSAISLADLKKNYNPAAMDAADISPDDWVEWDKEDRAETLEMLLNSFKELRAFYQQAAAEGKAVVYAWG